MRSIVRAKQPVLTRINPHPGNKRIISNGGGAVQQWPARKKSYDFTHFPIDPAISFSRGSTGTYWDENGVLKTAAINEPRPYRQPTGGAILGLMIEEARTNTIRNSVAAGAVAGIPGTNPTNWIIGATTGGLTKEIVGSGVENGIEYVDIRYFGTSATINVFASIYGDQISNTAAVNGETFSTSFFWKLLAGSFTDISCRQSIFDASFVYLAEAGISGLLPPNSELSRISCTGTIANAATAFINGYVQIRFPPSSPVDFTIRIGLPQTEKAATVSSPIKTTGAAANRQGDNQSVSGGNFSSWWNPSEGTIFARWQRDTPNGINSTNLVQINSNGANYLVIILRAPGYLGLLVAVGGITEVDFTTNPIITGQGVRAEMAFVYKLNDYAACFNGGSVLTDNSANVPPCTNMLLGLAPFTGYIASIDYWNTRLTNAQIQGLTKT